MTLLILLLLILILAGGGGLGAWHYAPYRSEWISLAAILVVLLLVFWVIAPASHAPPVIVR
jgi:hypothetical protein